jgi:hypothetical protein
MTRMKRKKASDVDIEAEVVEDGDAGSSPRKRTKTATLAIKTPLPDVTISRQIREQWRVSTSRLLIKKSSDEATGRLILARLFNGNLPRDENFSEALKSAAAKYFFNNSKSARKLVFEYGRVLSAFITKIKMEWFSAKLPTIDSDATYDDPWQLVVHLSRTTYPVDVKSICMKVPSGLMRDKSDAIDKFKKIYDVSTLFLNRPY